MFVHFERWTLPVLTTWMYAWQDKTVIDAHDKLLKLFSNTSTFRNQYIYIYIQDCVEICHLSHGRISVHFCTMQWWNMEAGHTSLTKVSFSESFCFFVIFVIFIFFVFFLFLFLVQAPRVSTYTGNSSLSSRQVLQDECIAFTIPHLSYMYCILTNQNLDFHLKIIKYFCFQLARFKSNLTPAHLFITRAKGTVMSTRIEMLKDC